MRPALVEGTLSTALYHKYYSLAGTEYPLCNDRWFLLVHLFDAKGPQGEPSPNPEREWMATFVHGKPFVPAGCAPVFKAYSSPEYEAKQERWLRQLFDEVSQRFGVRDNAEVKCWMVKEAQVDRLLDFLFKRAAEGEFAG